MFLIIMVFFSVGTIVGALAKNMTVLLLARSIRKLDLFSLDLCFVLKGNY